MTQALLEGNVDNRDELIETLQEQNADLLGQIASLKNELAQAKRANTQAVMNLRRQLEPLHLALKAVFGEIEAIAPGHEDANEKQPARKASAVWEAWKARLGSAAAKCIDALLVHGDLSNQQLAIATGLNRNTVRTSGIYELNKAGLINKNGGRFSLKQLP